MAATVANIMAWYELLRNSWSGWRMSVSDPSTQMRTDPMTWLPSCMLSLANAVLSGASDLPVEPPSASSMAHDESNSACALLSLLTTWMPMPGVAASAEFAGPCEAVRSMSLTCACVGSTVGCSTPSSPSTGEGSSAWASISQLAEILSAVRFASVSMFSVVYVWKCCSHTKDTTPMATSAVMAAMAANASVTREV